MASPAETAPDAPPPEDGGAKPRPRSTTTTTPPSPPGPSEPPAVTGDDGVNPLDFDGSVDSNHELPSRETIREIDDYLVLDRHGKSHTFRSLYTGPHAARRVLVIFVRHFYCGNCQAFLRTLSESITPAALLALPLPTSLVVVGCGDPALIDAYAAAVGGACPLPIYADPSRRLYDALGMVRTLALGGRPAYAREHLLRSSAESVVMGLRQLGRGLAHKGGDAKQVGGEFLFEPAGLVAAAAAAAAAGVGVGAGEKAVAVAGMSGMEEAAAAAAGGLGDERGSIGQASLDGKGEPEARGEDKVVTWCHRMRTTRDHAEIPELMEVLGLEGHGRPVEDRERWERALRERKGTGASLLAGQMREMKAQAQAGAGTA